MPKFTSLKFNAMEAVYRATSRFIFLGFEVNGVRDLGFLTEQDEQLCLERYGTCDINALIDAPFGEVNYNIQALDCDGYKELWLAHGWNSSLRPYPAILDSGPEVVD